ncbi:MAG: helix-turn-helix domain-containing protein [Sinobacteraceae bacterium]|nr:helix-turn-helix domain-containing protein [Nevskiaceae bacterium]
MSTIVDKMTPALAQRIATERAARGWSLAELAQRSGVSRAMLSKIERGNASPTAALLGRLSGAFGLTLSALLARAERAHGRLVRAAAQLTWQDPASGYIRRQVSPPSDLPLELIEVELPAGAEVSFPASSYAFIRQIIWVIRGCLIFVEGAEVHELGAGDSLLLGAPTDCTFRVPGAAACHYLVAVLKQ